MTISRADTGPNERDAQIAIAQAFGLSQEEIGKRVCTPDSPSGVTGRTVYNRIKTNAKFIEDITRFTRSLRSEREVEVKALNKSQIRDAMEKELGTAWGYIMDAIKQGDTDSAWRLIEHQIGKPSQVHKVEGETTVNHVVWQPQPVRQLLQQEKDMLDSDLLLRALPEAQEAELVETS